MEPISVSVVEIPSWRAHIKRASSGDLDLTGRKSHPRNKPMHHI
jgi:hypothetical protein